jgi:hypothetical protein
MAKRRTRAASWAACKKAIAGWPRAGIVALIQELYHLSEENRRFLHTRLLDQLGEFNLEEVRKKITKLVSPSAVFDDSFRHSDVKRVIDQYGKASGDSAGSRDCSSRTSTARARRSWKSVTSRRSSTTSMRR